MVGSTNHWERQGDPSQAVDFHTTRGTPAIAVRPLPPCPVNPTFVHLLNPPTTLGQTRVASTSTPVPGLNSRRRGLSLTGRAARRYTPGMRKLLLPVLIVAAAGCHFADAPTAREDAANVSGYDPQKLRAASAAAYNAGRK